MAITPTEAAKLTEAELAIVDSEESYIDGQLRSPKDYLGRRIATPRTQSHRIREELLRRYRAVGWRVETKTDPIKHESWWEFYVSRGD